MSCHPFLTHVSSMQLETLYDCLKWFLRLLFNLSLLYALENYRWGLKKYTGLSRYICFNLQYPMLIKVEAIGMKRILQQMAHRDTLFIVAVGHLIYMPILLLLFMYYLFYVPAAVSALME